MEVAPPSCLSAATIVGMNRRAASADFFGTLLNS